jgi:uncharacterized protein (TIGR02147 family)
MPISKKFHYLDSNIFDFKDYIPWLQAYHEKAKKNVAFYHDFQNRIAKLPENVHGHFKAALSNSNGIVHEDIPELAKALLLTKGEIKYLSLLVQRTQASNVKENEFLSEEISGFWPNIFEYDNHQEYFYDLYKRGRKDREGKSYERLSYARIAEEMENIRAAIPGTRKNPSVNLTFFRNVIKGLSNLSPSTAKELAIVFRLQKQEAIFLNKLVEFNRLRMNKASSEQTKQKRLIKMEVRKQILKNELEFFSFTLPKTSDHTFLNKWYYGLIRELLRTKKDIDEKAIFSLAKSIPPDSEGDITEKDILKAIDVLRETKHLEYNPEKGIFYLPKKFRKWDFSISTSEDQDVIFNYHEQIANLLFRSIRSVPYKERLLKTSILSVSEKNKEKIELILKKALDKILKLADKKQPIEKVCQVLIGCIPLTREYWTGGDKHND